MYLEGSEVKKPQFWAILQGNLAKNFGPLHWGGAHHSKIKNFITDHLQMYQTFDSKCKIPGTSNFFFIIFL